MDKLKKRMYFFVPYNISDIQKGIQAGHSALEHVLVSYIESNNFIELLGFIKDHKTWVILNGGTTNSKLDEDGIPRGTMDQIKKQLEDNDVLFSYFYEPDLNDALTALCFVVDERVYNKKDYPDLDNYLTQESSEQLFGSAPNEYDWLCMIGGSKNKFLRDLLKDKKLA